MIKKWILKAIIQKTISFLPFKERINYWFQKHITKGVFLSDQYFNDKITHAKDHIAFFEKYSENTKKKTALELGTGWYPIIPIALFLCDFQLIYTFDSQNWLTKSKLKSTFDKILSYSESEWKVFLPKVNIKKLEELNEIYKNINSLSIEETLEKMEVFYRVTDINTYDFGGQKFEFICSNNTLEHIKTDNIKLIFRSFKSVLNENGVMSHFIDMTDHFAHFDRTITIYNFLKYSDFKWSIIDNSIQAQNRLRYYDYLTLYSEMQLEICHSQTRKGNVDLLKDLPIDVQWKGYILEDLAITHTYLVTK